MDSQRVTLRRQIDDVIARRQIGRHAGRPIVPQIVEAKAPRLEAEVVERYALVEEVAHDALAPMPQDLEQALLGRRRVVAEQTPT